MTIPFSSPAHRLLELSCLYCGRGRPHPGQIDACDHFHSDIDFEIHNPAFVGPAVPADLLPARVLKLDRVPVAAEARYKDLGPDCFAAILLALRVGRMMALKIKKK